MSDYEDEYEFDDAEGLGDVAAVESPAVHSPVPEPTSPKDADDYADEFTDDDEASRAIPSAVSVTGVVGVGGAARGRAAVVGGAAAGRPPLRERVASASSSPLDEYSGDEAFEDEPEPEPATAPITTAPVPSSSSSTVVPVAPVVDESSAVEASPSNRPVSATSPGSLSRALDASYSQEDFDSSDATPTESAPAAAVTKTEPATVPVAAAPSAAAPSPAASTAVHSAPPEAAAPSQPDFDVDADEYGDDDDFADEPATPKPAPSVVASDVPVSAAAASPVQPTPAPAPAATSTSTKPAIAPPPPTNKVAVDAVSSVLPVNPPAEVTVETAPAPQTPPPPATTASAAPSSSQPPPKLNDTLSTPPVISPSGEAASPPASEVAPPSTKAPSASAAAPTPTPVPPPVAVVVVNNSGPASKKKKAAIKPPPASKSNSTSPVRASPPSPVAPPPTAAAPTSARSSISVSAMRAASRKKVKAVDAAASGVLVEKPDPKKAAEYDRARRLAMKAKRLAQAKSRARQLREQEFGGTSDEEDEEEKEGVSSSSGAASHATSKRASSKTPILPPPVVVDGADAPPPTSMTDAEFLDAIFGSTPRGSARKSSTTTSKRASTSSSVVAPPSPTAASTAPLPPPAIPTTQPTPPAPRPPQARRPGTSHGASSSTRANVVAGTYPGRPSTASNFLAAGAASSSSSTHEEKSSPRAPSFDATDPRIVYAYNDARAGFVDQGASTGAPTSSSSPSRVRSRAATNAWARQRIMSDLSVGMKQNGGGGRQHGKWRPPVHAYSTRASSARDRIDIDLGHLSQSERDAADALEARRVVARAAAMMRASSAVASETNGARGEASSPSSPFFPPPPRLNATAPRTVDVPRCYPASHVAPRVSAARFRRGPAAAVTHSLEERQLHQAAARHKKNKKRRQQDEHDDEDEDDDDDDDEQQTFDLRAELAYGRAVVEGLRQRAAALASSASGGGGEDDSASSSSSASKAQQRLFQSAAVTESLSRYYQLLSRLDVRVAQRREEGSLLHRVLFAPPSPNSNSSTSAAASATAKTKKTSTSSFSAATPSPVDSWHTRVGHLHDAAWVDATSAQATNGVDVSHPLFSAPSPARPSSGLRVHPCAPPSIIPPYDSLVDCHVAPPSTAKARLIRATRGKELVAAPGLDALLVARAQSYELTAAGLANEARADRRRRLRTDVPHEAISQRPPPPSTAMQVQAQPPPPRTPGAGQRGPMSRRMRMINSVYASNSTHSRTHSNASTTSARRGHHHTRSSTVWSIGGGGGGGSGVWPSLSPANKSVLEQEEGDEDELARPATTHDYLRDVNLDDYREDEAEQEDEFEAAGDPSSSSPGGAKDEADAEAAIFTSALKASINGGGGSGAGVPADDDLDEFHMDDFDVEVESATEAATPMRTQSANKSGRSSRVTPAAAPSSSSAAASRTADGVDWFDLTERVWPTFDDEEVTRDLRALGLVYGAETQVASSPSSLVNQAPASASASFNFAASTTPLSTHPLPEDSPTRLTADFALAERCLRVVRVQLGLDEHEKEEEDPVMQASDADEDEFGALGSTPLRPPTLARIHSLKSRLASLLACRDLVVRVLVSLRAREAVLKEAGLIDVETGDLLLESSSVLTRTTLSRISRADRTLLDAIGEYARVTRRTERAPQFASGRFIWRGGVDLAALVLQQKALLLQRTTRDDDELAGLEHVDDFGRHGSRVGGGVGGDVAIERLAAASLAERATGNIATAAAAIVLDTLAHQARAIKHAKAH